MDYKENNFVINYHLITKSLVSSVTNLCSTVGFCKKFTKNVLNMIRFPYFEKSYNDNINI